MSKPAPERILTLREEFDRLLNSHGVDCFTIYAEDLWQPGEWIPQEVDTALFYPEAAYVGPTQNFANEIRAKIERESPTTLGDPHGVSGAFVTDVRSDPLLSRSVLPPHPLEHRKLYSGFVDREEIVSCAVFIPNKPRISDDMLREILFLNFRKPQTFDPASKESLVRLANMMLHKVPSQVRERNRNAYAPAKTMIRAFTSLLKEVNSQLNNPSRKYDRRFFNTIACSLHDVLNTDGRNSPKPDKDHPNMIVSIYLSEANEAKQPITDSVPARRDLEKQQTLRLIGSSFTEEKHKRKQQPLYTNGSPSITTCTTMTGGPLMLHRIDKYWPPDGDVSARDGEPEPSVSQRRVTEETSLELTKEQMYCVKIGLRGPAETIQTFDDNTAFEPGWGFSLTENPVASSGPTARLILHTPCSFELNSAPTEQQLRRRSDQCQSLLSALQRSKLGQQWPVLVDKATRRMRCQYSHIFGPLDKRWEPPSAEVCVPIRFAGQTIGCVNIESKAIDRFAPTVIGLLTSLAAMIGTAAARNRDIEMMDRLDDVTRAIHNQKIKSEIPDKRKSAATRLAPSRHAAEVPLPQTIHTTQPPPIIPPPIFHIRDDRYKLCELSKSVAKACWADLCAVVRTGVHKDDPIRFLATSSFQSHDASGWVLPRPNGLTAWVAKHKDENFVGLWVSRFDDDAGSETKPRCFSLLQNPSDLSISVQEESNLSTEVPIQEELVLPNSGLLSIRVPSTRSNEGKEEGQREGGEGRTIVGLSFSRRMFDDPPVGSSEYAHSAEQREQYLGYVFSVCKRLGVVAAHWESLFLQEMTESKDVRHSAFFREIRDALHYLETGILELDGRDTSPQGIARVLKSLFTESQMAKRLFATATGNPAPYADLACADTPIGDIVREAWWMATWLCRPSDSNGLTMEIHPSLDGAKDGVNGPLLYFLLLQIFVNSMTYGDKVRPVVHVRAIGDRTSSEWTIQDVGPGFHPSMLRGMPEYNRRMPPLITGKRGRGFDMMLRAARKLNPSAEPGDSLEWSNYEEQGRKGACIKFGLMNWGDSVTSD